MFDRVRSQPSQPGPTRHQPMAAPDDSGLTLIEVIVAMGLFLILISASMTVLLVSLRTTEVNRDRVAAASLASRELEILRDQFSADTRGPQTVTANEVVNENPITGAAGSPVVLDNVRYTVTRDAQWATADAAAASTCDTGTNAELAYLRVKVTVTWDRMTGQGITMDTILTPPKGTYPPGKGHIGVRVVDAAGKPGDGHHLKVTNSSGSSVYGTTALDGCAVFPFLNPGTYTVSVDESTFVNRSGIQKATLTAVVQAGQMWRGAIDYDKSATIVTTFVTGPDGFVTPTINDIPISLGNSGILPAGSMARTGTGDIRSVTNLWPFPSGYQLWAGTCLDADPQYTGQARDEPINNPAGYTSAPVRLAPLRVTGADGTIVYATHAVDTSCPDDGTGVGAKIRLGTITGGELKTSAPYGFWSLRPGSAGGTEKATVRLVRGGGPETAVLP